MRRLSSAEAIEALLKAEFPQAFFEGSGLSLERVESIRKAYVEALRDPMVVEIAKRQTLDIDPISAAEIEKIVRDLYAAPPAAIERAKQMVPQG